MSTGLYDLNTFKDSCGFGMIAHIHGKASHYLLQRGIQALTCMTHRGAIAADGKTGDGCGVLLQKPDTFLRHVARNEGIDIGDQYAVASLMLSVDEATRRTQKQHLEQLCQQHKLTVNGWRQVPINSSCLGEIALKSLPMMEHLFVSNTLLSKKQFNALLLVLRRKIENKLAMEQLQDSFYISSFSTDVLVYKGLMLPADLPNFYLDLNNPLMQTAICIFHQRFSTNTSPQWKLAQPFRMLAHNGEINTIVGNRNWSVGRTPLMQSELFNQVLETNISEIAPLVNTEGSDSSSLDNMLEFLTLGGIDLHHAIRMIVPPAWKNVHQVPPAHRAFYQYNAMHIEPWDGPAGLAISDGRYVVCALDRNGLRPSRWVLTDDNIIIAASEMGVYDCPPQNIIAKGRLGPGEILSIDVVGGKVRHTKEIDDDLSSRHPFGKWLQGNAIRIKGDLFPLASEQDDLEPAQLHIMMKQFLATYEESEQVLRTMATTGQEATGSMGDDIPIAVLSRQQRPMYDYFRQQFAQVTNPPIDSLREAVVMSLETIVGAEYNLFSIAPFHTKRVIYSSPVLSTGKYKTLLALEDLEFQSLTLSLNYDPEQIDLKSFVTQIADTAEQAAASGVHVLVLSDRNISSKTLPAQALLCLGATHQRLIEKGLRCQTNIIVDTASARDPHHFACLIGYGATAVHPYLSYYILNQMVADGDILDSYANAHINFRKAINKGLLKILSKMGISTIASYRGSQLFEAVGLGDEVINLCFKGTSSRIQGVRFKHIEADLKQLHRYSWDPRKKITPGGLLKYIHGQEYHCFNPDVVLTLNEAVKNNDYTAWKDYADLVNKRPIATLRDMFKLRYAKEPLPLEQVEPVSSIVKRFDSAGMSLGALSPEAHQSLAQALNTLGGRSNSGEGGEDPERYGTLRNSAIKQVASGRFGVTAQYLRSAKVIQIKVAQGAKPGEGGQLPGGKVNQLIARLRFSMPGVTLISPPPHHDVYSIEDLAQLIYDLKQVNPSALVSVKLVSRPGVGTIATGVAKAYADMITISGHDGGTAASPLSSIRYAGSPWELGLAETHQMLCANDLRGKVRLQTDGGLKTGLDIIKAAILGAESFGFGTAPMVALGCKYLRICHLNNCATGVATQDERLRSQYYLGTVDMAINFFTFIAEETRGWLAALGVSSIDKLIGRVDLLELIEEPSLLSSRQQCLDLSPILYTDELLKSKPQFCQISNNRPYDKGELSAHILDTIRPSIRDKTSATFNFNITNRDRSIGAQVAGEILALQVPLSDNSLTLNFKGVAGQSFGVWNITGLHLKLEGDANDYVGKGMSGGSIVIFPDRNSRYHSQETIIVGNTCLYGATGGKFFASGKAGERFAVRNSGAYAVIEGAGQHCCEYMTGGVVAVLGDTGSNFGAGMTGGFAFVLDLNRTFVDKYNEELIEIKRITDEYQEGYNNYLQGMIKEHYQQTKSHWARQLFYDFDDYVGQFWLVKPKAASLRQLLQQTVAAPQ